MRQLFATDHRWQPARKIIAPACHQHPKPQLVRDEHPAMSERTAEALPARSSLLRQWMPSEPHERRSNGEPSTPGRLASEGHLSETNVRPKRLRRLGSEPPGECGEKSLAPAALGGAAIREERGETSVAFGGAVGEQCGGKPIAHEDTIIAILARPTPTGELPSLAFQRKEQELGAVFAQLSVVDSLELDRRLSINAPTDPIARLFSRFIPERRARLIAFVRDARRREAVARSRAG